MLLLLLCEGIICRLPYGTRAMFTIVTWCKMLCELHARRLTLRFAARRGVEKAKIQVQLHWRIYLQKDRGTYRQI